MANIKIAQLNNKTTLADSDSIIIETAEQTQKMTVGNLKNLLGIQYGGIEESGSNAYGTYIKYKDGTMIQRGNLNINTPASGNSSSGTITFPLAFFTSEYSIDMMQSTGHGNLAYSIIAFGGRGVGKATNVFEFNYACIVGSWSAAVGITVSWKAIGRWKA